jgi:hypothetical protein
MKRTPEGGEEVFMVRLVGVVMVVLVLVLVVAAGVVRAQEKAPTRVAVLDFGPAGDVPRDCDEIGIHITAKMFADVVPLLQKDGVEVVVLRVNSPGGMDLEEAHRLQDLWEEQYKPRFRVVVWIDKAIGDALKSVWGIEELYCVSADSPLGACTFGHPYAKDSDMEREFDHMTEISRRGHHEPSIMRSMQSFEPLSADVEAGTGAVKWRQDGEGATVLNPQGQILILNGAAAVRFKVVRAIASDREALARAMGIEHVEWVGAAASAAVDAELRQAEIDYSTAIDDSSRYLLLIQWIEAAREPVYRSELVEQAKTRLAAVEKILKKRPAFARGVGLMGGYLLDDEYFELQREKLRKLEGKKPSGDKHDVKSPAQRKAECVFPPRSWLPCRR